MPPAAGGSAPGFLDLEITRLLAREAARQQASLFSPQGFPKGLSPLCRRRHSSSLLLNVYATVACRRRLQKAPRRIHERLPRTHSRPAQGLDKDPKLVWDMLEAGNAKAPRLGLAESGCAQEKAELYLLEKAGRCSAAGGSAPGPRPGNNDACWRAKPRANRRHCFPQGFPKGSALCRRRHSSSLLLNVYATVACRRRLQKAPRRIHERLPSNPFATGARP